MDVDPRTRAASTYACADVSDQPRCFAVSWPVPVVATLTKPDTVFPVLQSSRFTGVHQVNSQYCQLYYQRLVSVMPRVKAAAEARWPGVPVCKVLELQDGQPCVMIGTLYKDMKLKPSILDEYVKDVRPCIHLHSRARCTDTPPTTAVHAPRRHHQLQVCG